MAERNSKHLYVQLGALTIGRLFLNTGIRMAYPFLPELARGLNVSLAAVSRLVSLRSLASLLSPLFGPLSERFGRRPIIALSLLLFSLGCVLILIWPAYWPFGLAFSTIAVAKVVYDPAMQAYLGDVVPYRQRGRALAVTEFSWAGAFFLGVPAIGFVIARQGWQAPFLWMALFAAGAAALLWRTLPAADARSGRVNSLRTTARVIRRQPVIWAAAAYIFLVMAANELVLIVYGEWMEGTFRLNLTSLGLATGVIGGAEIIGELLTGLAVDSFGKRPIVILFGLLTAMIYVIIPFTSIGLISALVTLFVLFLFFEMTVVGGVPLMTELVPAARGVVMSVVLAAGGLGRAVGALLGPQMWLAGGFRRLGLGAAVLMALGVLILARWLREGDADPLQFGTG